jgi:hypothetical protein
VQPIFSLLQLLSFLSHQPTASAVPPNKVIIHVIIVSKVGLSVKEMTYMSICIKKNRLPQIIDQEASKDSLAAFA